MIRYNDSGVVDGNRTRNISIGVRNHNHLTTTTERKLSALKIEWHFKRMVQNLKRLLYALKYEMSYDSLH